MFSLCVITMFLIMWYQAVLEEAITIADYIFSVCSLIVILMLGALLLLGEIGLLAVFYKGVM